MDHTIAFVGGVVAGLVVMIVGWNRVWKAADSIAGMPSQDPQD